MNLVEGAKAAVQGAMAKAAEAASGRRTPGDAPDPLIEARGGQVGLPASRLDGPLKTQGRATFAAEVALPGLTYAAVAFSTIARGRIASLDVAAAEASEGVVLVMTHRNAPKMAPNPLLFTSPKAGAGDGLAVMQDDRIHWNGQPIALILAETQEQADHAASLVVATYEEQEAVLTLAAAVAGGTRTGALMGEKLKVDIGDAEAALAAAAFKVDLRYATPPHNHNPIEPNAATILWENGALVAHGSVRGTASAAWSLGRIFGLDDGRVRVHAPFVGGAFGAKLLWWDEVLGAAGAKLVDRPVRIALSREAVYRMTGGRTPTAQRVAIGADRDGRFTAMIHTGAAIQADHGCVAEPFTNATGVLYSAETFALDVEVAHADIVANTFMRAPGESVGSFALETAIDELAEAMGVDPIELRLRNEPEQDPTTGRPFSARHLVEAYRAGAERFGWANRRAAGPMLDGEWRIGVGVATGTYPYQRFPGGAARITLGRDGSAKVGISADELGMGTATATAQVAADRLGLPLDKVTVDYGDSALPGMFRAGGSNQTAAIGAAVKAARDALIAELLKLIGNDSPLAGLKAEELVSRDGGLAARDEPARHERYDSILSRAARDELSVEAAAPPSSETKSWSMHSYSAVFCEAAVNAVTGEVRIRRLLGSFDCGRILNPKTAASQFRGGMIMALGMALMEETQVDARNGRIMNPSLAEYHVPVHMDVPEIDVIWQEFPDPHAPAGARGIGEIGMTGVAAAIANAVHHATGKRVRDLPVTLDKLL